MANIDQYRLRILKYADEILKHEGVKGLTVSNIVRKCCISKRSFYECFPDKEELISELKQMSNTNLDNKDEKLCILRAVEKEICASGINNVNLESVARTAGLKKGTIYKYFSDKYSLLECCIENQFKRMQAIIRQMYLPYREDPVGFIKEYVEGLSFFLNQSNSMMVFAEVRSHMNNWKKIEDLAIEQHTFMKEIFTKSIQKGIEKGLFRKDIDVDAVSDIILISTNGMPYHLPGKEGGPLIKKEITQGMTDMILNFLLIKKEA